MDLPQSSSEPSHMSILPSLAATFLARAKAQRWRGPTANDRAVEFFLGAWAGALAVAPNNPETERLGVFVSMVLPARGMAELRRIAKEP